MVYEWSLAMEKEAMERAEPNLRDAKVGYTHVYPQGRSFFNLTRVSNQIRTEFLADYLKRVPVRLCALQLARYVDHYYPTLDKDGEEINTSQYCSDITIEANESLQSPHIDLSPALRIALGSPAFKVRFGCRKGNASKFVVIEDLNQSMEQHQDAWNALSGHSIQSLQVHTFKASIVVHIDTSTTGEIYWPNASFQLNEASVLNQFGLSSAAFGDGWRVLIKRGDMEEGTAEGERVGPGRVTEFHGKRFYLPH
jgi:hypothetical protein